MGRRRRHNRDLPSKMYLRHGGYYYDSPTLKKWIFLSRDATEARAILKQIIGNGSRLLGKFDDVADKYIDEVLPLKRSEQTRRDQRRELERLKKVFGDVATKDITAQHCYLYMEARRDKNGRPVPTAARHEISLLGHVIAKAIRWGVATANPVRTLERIPRIVRRRYVTDAEFERVYIVASERMQIAMELAYLTGQRRGDLLSLTRGQLSDDGIAFRQSKTDAGILVEWSARLRAVVARAKALTPQVPGTYLLRTRTGAQYSAGGFKANWQRLMNKAVDMGVKRFTFHDLRAKAASDKGTLGEAQALLGHASSDTTKRVYKRNMTKAEPVR